MQIVLWPPFATCFPSRRCVGSKGQPGAAVPGRAPTGFCPCADGLLIAEPCPAGLGARCTTARLPQAEGRTGSDSFRRSCGPRPALGSGQSGVVRIRGALAEAARADAGARRSGDRARLGPAALLAARALGWGVACMWGRAVAGGLRGRPGGVAATADLHEVLRSPVGGRCAELLLLLLLLDGVEGEQRALHEAGTAGVEALGGRGRGPGEAERALACGGGGEVERGGGAGEAERTVVRGVGDGDRMAGGGAGDVQPNRVAVGEGDRIAYCGAGDADRA